jgi:glutaminase
MPAKSGVAGGIVAVLPGKLGIGVFSPPLDKRGNSVRGIEVCNKISMDFNLHMFNVVQPGRSVIRSAYDGSNISSKHLRDADERGRLQQQAHRIQIFEIQGDLNFSTTEVIINQVVGNGADADYFIIDLKRVLSLDQSACRLFYQLQVKLADSNKQLLFTNCGACPALGKYMRRKMKFADGIDWRCYEDDYALEYCENLILDKQQATSDEKPLQSFELFDGLGTEEVEIISSKLTKQCYREDEVIIQQGEPASQLYLLARGQVSIKITLPDGKIKRLATLSPGLVFGEMAWIERSERSAAVSVDVDAICYKLDISDFDAMMAEHAALKAKLLENMCRLFSRNLRKANTEIGVLS